MIDKHLLQSKTFWFNFIVITLTLADLQATSKYAPATIALGNVILRLLTSAPCTVFPTSKPKP